MLLPKVKAALSQWITPVKVGGSSRSPSDSGQNQREPKSPPPEPQKNATADPATLTPPPEAALELPRIPTPPKNHLLISSWQTVLELLKRPTRGILERFANRGGMRHYSESKSARGGTKRKKGAIIDRKAA